MEFLVRLVQQHESFRKPELEALGQLHNLELKFVTYNETSPFCIVKLRNAEAARILVSRSILTQSIHELWGNGSTYDDLHTNVKEATSDRWQDYMQCSFKFVLDAYQHSRSPAERREIVESFSYMGFQGPIRMKDVDETFTVFEDYEYQGKVPQRLYLGRFLGPGNRDLINTYTLKKRKYLLTTSMDSELALVMANLALASSGKLFYDPFVGSGSLPLACSHFGAYALGSDMDGRCVRGKKGVNVESSFAQYNLGMRYFGGFVADLTHCPLRDVRGGFMDGIVCDPPYGVREGLKVLGRKNGERKEIMYIEGEAAHLRDDFIPPRQPYSFEAMLVDILNFASVMLVENGRLSMWMPTANDEEQELEIPQHGALELMSECIQPFNKWSRRLLTYRRKRASEVTELPVPLVKPAAGNNADDLNSFRRRYFQGFTAEAKVTSTPDPSETPG